MQTFKRAAMLLKFIFNKWRLGGRTRRGRRCTSSQSNGGSVEACSTVKQVAKMAAAAAAVTQLTIVFHSTERPIRRRLVFTDVTAQTTFAQVKRFVEKQVNPARGGLVFDIQIGCPSTTLQRDGGFGTIYSPFLLTAFVRDQIIYCEQNHDHAMEKAGEIVVHAWRTSTYITYNPDEDKDLAPPPAKGPKENKSLVDRFQNLKFPNIFKG